MSKIVDSIIGHAVGDAMGVPIEFTKREKLQDKKVTKMLGYGTYDVCKGSWSDDTSMEIALIDSLINKNGFDYKDIMNNFLCWMTQDKYTANGEVFDVGITCMNAILNYRSGIEPLKCGLNGEKNNGNGSLMRILPVALYSYYKKLSENDIITLTNNVSSLTHSHEISKLGCYIYVRYVMFLLDGLSKEEAYKKIQELNYNSYDEYAISKYNRILDNNIKEFEINDISSKGYIVDSLESSLWALLNNNNYENTIIEAINLGNDTDTIGAITGSMAGILYGMSSIPKDWLDDLLRKDYLIDISKKFEGMILSKK